jgi:hypothetical protein
MSFLLLILPNVQTSVPPLWSCEQVTLQAGEHHIFLLEKDVGVGYRLHQ